MKTNKALEKNIIISYVTITLIALLLLFMIGTTASAQLLLDDLIDRITHADDCPANPINGGTGPCNCGASNNNDLSPIQPAPDIEGDSQYSPPDQYIGPDVEPPDIQYVDPDQNYDDLLPGDIVVITPGDQDSTTPYPDIDPGDEVIPPSSNDQPYGTDYTGDDYAVPVPPSISTDHIPDAALPAAAGASAIILALGALGAASANGVPPHEALGELKELFRGRQNPPTGGRSPEDIVANPSLHDRITDANGKKWVYYQLPGDIGGSNYWIPAEDYDHNMQMQKEGRTYSERYGWTDAKQRAEFEKNREIDDRGDIKDRKRLRENIRRDQEENNRRMQAEIDRRNAIENKRLELEELELQSELDSYSTSNTFRTAVRDSSREIFTGVGKTFDPETGTYVDSISFKAMGLRMIVGAATGGSSELLYNPVEGSHRILDRIAEGESFGSALGGTLKNMTVEELQGKGIATGARALTGLLKHGTPLSGGAVRQTGDLSGPLQKQADAVEDILRTKDPVHKTQKIKELYKDCGGKKLAELEKAGKLSAKQAAEINKVVTSEVNDAVKSATTKTMKDYRIAGKDGIRVEVEGVKVKEVMVGDSGSSAKTGKGRSIFTDHDRTTYVSFDNDSLADYARRNNISIEEAHQRLNKTFVDKQQTNLDQALQTRGFEPGDVDQKIFSSIESNNSRCADVYPPGYTATRQACQGNTDIYSVDKGHMKNPYSTSGEAMTDRMALDSHNKTVDTNIGPVIGGNSTARLNEAKLLAQRQSSAMANLDSAEKAAKTLERIDKAAALAGSERVPPGLADTAKKIRLDPQDMLSRLSPEEQNRFIDAAREYGGQVVEKIVQTEIVTPPWGQ